ncbi:MAG: hypothetical protein KGZ42_00685 [Melioribacter sp.]|nr:hypothetical protein [Melioribacter sp.]
MFFHKKVRKVENKLQGLIEFMPIVKYSKKEQLFAALSNYLGTSFIRD